MTGTVVHMPRRKTTDVEETKEVDDKIKSLTLSDNTPKKLER